LCVFRAASLVEGEWEPRRALMIAVVELVDDKVRGCPSVFRKKEETRKENKGRGIIQKYPEILRM
jgi:hypothetical protein